MQAEEVEDHVGVDFLVGVAGKINYEEPGSGSAADFFLGVEIELNERETVPAPPTKPSFSLANERETVPAAPTMPRVVFVVRKLQPIKIEWFLLYKSPNNGSIPLRLNLKDGSNLLRQCETDR